MKNGYTFSLPLPPSINRTYKTTRTGGFYMANKSKLYKESTVPSELLALKIKPLEGPVEVWLTFFFPTKAGDADGRTKILFDAMQRYAYENDKQIARYHVEKAKDAANPRVDVTICETQTTGLAAHPLVHVVGR